MALVVLHRGCTLEPESHHSPIAPLMLPLAARALAGLTSDNASGGWGMHLVCGNMCPCPFAPVPWTRGLELDLAPIELPCPLHMPCPLHLRCQVDAHNSTRVALAADVADGSVAIKQLVVAAEDARLRRDMQTMRRAYRQIYDLNRSMIVDYDKRASNHAALLEGLRGVNAMIQRAGRLRVGAPQARVVAACRAAVKANNLQALLRIVCEGDAAGV